jgi:hypothetical protein
MQAGCASAATHCVTRARFGCCVHTPSSLSTCWCSGRRVMVVTSRMLQQRSNTTVLSGDANTLELCLGQPHTVHHCRSAMLPPASDACCCCYCRGPIHLASTAGGRFSQKIDCIGSAEAEMHALSPNRRHAAARKSSCQPATHNSAMSLPLSAACAFSTLMATAVLRHVP